MAPASILARSPGSNSKNHCSHGGIRFKNLKTQQYGGRVKYRFQWTYCDSSPDYFAVAFDHRPSPLIKLEILYEKVSTRGQNYVEGWVDVGGKGFIFELLKTGDHSEVYDQSSVIPVKPNRA
ncbi:hypothetical protein FRC04_006810 [Tulasnella sp. 424]|nr:hypothetical protein FRC04_006810 [Tulasnella sp. 424]KAG8972640.1 hypothetical protein FRC05_009750 [Tulasnella sp. 425]